MAQRLRTLEINIFLIRYDRAKERIAALNQTLEGLRDVLLHHEARLNELNSQREQLEEAISRLELEELAQARLQKEHLQCNRQALQRGPRGPAAHCPPKIESLPRKICAGSPRNRKKPERNAAQNCRRCC